MDTPTLLESLEDLSHKLNGTIGLRHRQSEGAALSYINLPESNKDKPDQLIRVREYEAEARAYTQAKLEIDNLIIKAKLRKLT